MQFKNERERLIAEHAVLAYREVEAAGDRAVFGQGLAALEDAVLEQGRQQQRRVLELALRSRAEAQKKGAVANGAAAGAGPKGRAPRA